MSWLSDALSAGYSSAQAAWTADSGNALNTGGGGQAAPTTQPQPTSAPNPTTASATITASSSVGIPVWGWAIGGVLVLVLVLVFLRR